MNTTQNAYEKRTIKVKDFLEDFHAGVSDVELMSKYHLTDPGLEKFYTMLEERGILFPEDFAARCSDEPDVDLQGYESDSGQYGLVCPSCGVPIETAFDVCPDCGASPLEFAESEPVNDRLSSLQDLPPSRQERDDVGYAGRRDFEKNETADEPIFDEELVGATVSYMDDDEIDVAESAACDRCHGELEAGVRGIYDKKRGLTAFAFSGVMFLMSLLLAASLHFFDGYSFGRLLVVFGTVLTMMAGCAFLAVGGFMALAREKVYRCTECLSVYPRG
jgi:hypothetical protein